MRNQNRFILTAAIALQFFACKKDSKTPAPTYTGSLTSFDITGDVYQSKNDNAHSLYIMVNDSVNLNAVAIKFTTSGSANKVTVNGTGVASGQAVNATGTLTVKLLSPANSVLDSWTVTVEKEASYFGLGINVQAQASLDKSYKFYFDQFDGSTYQAINCGPTVSTMAITWADPSFSSTPLAARNTIPEGGGWWYTTDISNYLNMHGIDNITVPINDLPTLVKQVIDNGDLMILCLDMYYVTYNGTAQQHTNKFYQTDATGWGHFLLVKGYKQVDSKFYLDIYDPYSDHNTYASPFAGQLKGTDRFYESTTINAATSAWWQYTIVLAPKGQKAQVPSSLKLQTNSLAKIPAASGR